VGHKLVEEVEEIILDQLVQMEALDMEVQLIL
jgi:hypothetical protein